MGYTAGGRRVAGAQVAATRDETSSCKGPSSQNNRLSSITAHVNRSTLFSAPTRSFDPRDRWLVLYSAARFFAVYVGLPRSLTCYVLVGAVLNIHELLLRTTPYTRFGKQAIQHMSVRPHALGDNLTMCLAGDNDLVADVATYLQELFASLFVYDLRFLT